jgi:hypothetical protein
MHLAVDWVMLDELILTAPETKMEELFVEMHVALGDNRDMPIRFREWVRTVTGIGLRALVLGMPLEMSPWGWHIRDPEGNTITR